MHPIVQFDNHSSMSTANTMNSYVVIRGLCHWGLLLTNERGFSVDFVRASENSGGRSSKQICCRIGKYE